jgi:hypothetical protein
MGVRNSGKSILAPPIGSKAGLLMGHIPPGISVGAIIFSDGSPLTLGEIRSPFEPIGLSLDLFFDPVVFGGMGGWHGDWDLRGNALFQARVRRAKKRAPRREPRFDDIVR